MAATFLNNNVAKIGQNWPILTYFQTSLGYFYVFQVVKHTKNEYSKKNVTFSKIPLL
jgi:hypothetical protein